MGYTPMCGRCKQTGHTANDCMAPQPVKQVQFTELDKDKDVNHISKVTSHAHNKSCRFVTRSKNHNNINNPIVESDQASSSDSDFKQPKTKTNQ